MTFFSFTKHLGTAAGNNAANKLMEVFAEKMPELTDEAQVADMEEALDKAALKIEEIRRNVAADQHTYDTANAHYQTMMAAATHLEDEMNTATDPGVKQSKSESLTRLVTDIEPLQREVLANKDEVDKGQSLITDLEDAYQKKATEIANSRTELKRARQDVDRAKLTEQRSNERAEAARVAAGLVANHADGMHTAVDALHRIAEQSREKAAANDLKAKALGAAHSTTETDPNIAAAMAAVAGTGNTNTSVADRLAALRAKQ